MTQPPMAGPQSQGLAAQGPLPAGMLRIHQGNQERYVWPVHLPGWLALGWRVAGSGTAPVPVPEAVAPAVAPAKAPEPTVEEGPQPATARGRRGRRRKEVEQQPTGVEDTPAVIAAAAEDGDADPPAASELAAEPATDPEVPFHALPDDLFDDPLI